MNRLNRKFIVIIIVIPSGTSTGKEKVFKRRKGIWNNRLPTQMPVTVELHCSVNPPSLSTSLSVLRTVLAFLFHFEFHFWPSFCFLACFLVSGFWGDVVLRLVGVLGFFYLVFYWWHWKNGLINSGGWTSLFSDSFSNYPQVFAVGCCSESLCCLPTCLPIAILI